MSPRIAARHRPFSCPWPAAALAGLLWLAAAPLVAADLGIEVRDKGGRPVQGAAVAIAGPGGATQQGRTSDIGRVVFADLAAGEWSVTIEHAEFMRFNGWVDARAGKVAKETFSTQVATERSWVPLRVSYFSPASRDARAVQPGPARGAVAAPPAPTPTVAPPSPTASSAPPAVAEPMPRAAPVPVAAAAKPAPPQGVPSATPALVPAPGPQPAPTEPPVARPREPPAPRPGPTQEPEDRAAPAPALASSPPAQSATKGPSPYRSRALGTCPDCKPSEWAASAQVAALAGAGCEAGQASRLEAEFNAAAAATAGEVWSSGEAPCRLLAVRLPPGSRFLGYRFEAEDNRRAADCVGDEPCPVGEARFLGHPSVRKGDGTWIWAIFENRAGAPRLARLTAFFSAPAGWQGSPAR